MEWQRGTLSPEQVELIMRVLPVDVSFTDESDVLRYWKGETYKRCDGRYIGRDIRHCHPEHTLDRLEEILREFKAGSRDVAEAWQRKGDKLERTRYFAVRDRSGAYKGVLEVCQDIPAIAAIEGEQPFRGG